MDVLKTSDFSLVDLDRSYYFPFFSVRYEESRLKSKNQSQALSKQATFSSSLVADGQKREKKRLP